MPVQALWLLRMVSPDARTTYLSPHSPELLHALANQGAPPSKKRKRAADGPSGGKASEAAATDSFVFRIDDSALQVTHVTMKNHSALKVCCVCSDNAEQHI